MNLILAQWTGFPSSRRVLLMGAVLLGGCARAGLVDDFRRVDPVVVSKYMGFPVASVVACQRNVRNCPADLIFDAQNFYVTRRSADDPPEIAFWHLDGRRFIAVLNNVRLEPLLLMFDGTRMKDGSAAFRAQILRELKLNSLKEVRLALPRQGTTIEVVRNGQAIGYGQFVKTGFRFSPAGLMGAKQLLASPFCRTYQCRAYQTAETTTNVTVTGRPGVKPAFLMEVTFHAVSPTMYDIAMSRKEFANIDVQRVLTCFLTQVGSITTLTEIQAACRKPDNNPQAQYLACRDAAHSDKDLTIRVVR